MEGHGYVLARREVIALFIAALLCLLAAERGGATSSGGTTIDNTVTATYTDARGHSYSAQSNVIVATIAQIAAIGVSPKEPQANPQTETAAVGQSVTRTFIVTNGSNIADAYRVTNLVAGSLKIAKAQWVLPGGATQDASGGALSPSVGSGGFIKLTVTISTAGLTVGAQVPVEVTVQTTQTGTINGLQSDTGKEWIAGGSAPALNGPGGTNTQITKSVDKAATVQSQPGATVTFDIVAANSGGAAAQNVVVTDTLPPGLSAVASSVRINGQAAGSAAGLHGQVLTVNVGTVGAGATMDVSFDASVPPGQVLGETFVNIASVSADGIAAQQTTPASVLAGTANIVFDALGGSNHPVGGATVELLDAQGNPVKLSSGVSGNIRHTASTVSAGKQNPVMTGPDGAYGFALQPSQIGPSGSRFFLTISAPGYLNRDIQLDITPGAEDQLYDVKATALDGAPLAAAGGFTLTNNAVQLQNVFGLFGNLPLFKAHTIDVTKTPDREAAQGGDRVVYTLGFTNTSAIALGSTSIVDVLPPGLAYANGTARLDGHTPFEPAVDGRTLTWNIPALSVGASHAIAYATVIFPSVTEGSTLTNTVTVTSAILPSNAKVSGSASAAVVVSGGMFSERRIVTGRVFIDAAHSGHFVIGDIGIAGVRVYMEDGSYTVTDREGRFSFPSVRPGMHALRIDSTTLPAGVHGVLQRLLHGILDGATMEDVEFALEGGAR